MEYLSGLANWEFLDEPAYRWFIWLGALSLMIYLWGVILSFMQ